MPHTPSCIARRAARFAVLFVFVLSVAPLRAQCATQWTPGDGIPGTDGAVRVSTMWDPDGAGPAPARLVIGGTFAAVGQTLAQNIAVWDPATGLWSALGTGTDGDVFALAAHPSGDLIAAGSFTAAGGVAALRIARWNGTSWSALGSGINGVVKAVTTLPNGDVFAGGDFTVAGGVSATRIARWDGGSWSAMGSGMDQVVHALTTLPTGAVIAGGVFDTAGGVAAKNIASWDGAAWSSVGGGLSVFGGSFGAVGAMLALPNGDLVVTGFFRDAGGVSVEHIARWDGTAWFPIGSGLSGPQGHPSSITRLPNGDLVVAGFLSSVSPSSTGFDCLIHLWNGTSWSVLGRAWHFVHTLATLPGGELFAAGEFRSIDGVGLQFGRMARWSGSWSPMGVDPGSVTDDPVRSLAKLPNGDVVAGGLFTKIGGVTAHHIARWDGTNWSPLGGGMNGAVHALKVLANGDLIAGGSFTIAGGVTANHVARWNGSTWSAIGSGTNDAVHAVTQMPDGDIVAGGAFTNAGGTPAAYIARWNGLGWTAFGSGTGTAAPPGLSSETIPVRTLTVLPNGDLVAGGSFSSLDGSTLFGLARWNGSNWSPIGTLPWGAPWGAVWYATTFANGDLVIAGQFPLGEGIARWDGTSWTHMATWLTEPCFALAELPNGDLLAGGRFRSIAGTPCDRIARWNGSTWSAVDAGLNSNVHALVSVPNGDVIAGGEFVRAGALRSAYVARLTTTCPATATTFGAGCVGSGGHNTLTATTLPWVGSTFRATATGLPALSIVLTLTSVVPIPQGIAPLTLVFPQAGAGCDVLVDPHLLGALVSTTGTAQSELYLPPSSALLVMPFYHQMVVIDVDAGSGAWVEVTATNALELVAGAF